MTAKQNASGLDTNQLMLMRMLLTQEKPQTFTVPPVQDLGSGISAATANIANAIQHRRDQAASNQQLQAMLLQSQVQEQADQQAKIQGLIAAGVDPEKAPALAGLSDPTIDNVLTTQREYGKQTREHDLKMGDVDRQADQLVKQYNMDPGEAHFLVESGGYQNIGQGQGGLLNEGTKFQAAKMIVDNALKNKQPLDNMTMAYLGKIGYSPQEQIKLQLDIEKMAKDNAWIDPKAKAELYSTLSGARATSATATATERSNDLNSELDKWREARKAGTITQEQYINGLPQFATTAEQEAKAYPDLFKNKAPGNVYEHAAPVNPAPTPAVQPSQGGGLSLPAFNFNPDKFTGAFGNIGAQLGNYGGLSPGQQQQQAPALASGIMGNLNTAGKEAQKFGDTFDPWNIPGHLWNAAQPYLQTGGNLVSGLLQSAAQNAPPQPQTFAGAAPGVGNIPQNNTPLYNLLSSDQNDR